MGDGGGFQQIIIIGLFLLFGLADLIARWARGRTTPSRPREPVPRRAEDDPWQVDVPWQVEDASDDVVVQRPVRVDAPAPSSERVPERVTVDRARPARERAMRDRTSSVRQDVVRSAPVRVAASRLATGGMSARDRMATSTSGRRARGPRFTADDARRGVIAMTVLGPCRALEDSERE